MGIIDKNSNIPLHIQIYKVIKDGIESKAYKENESIPSESEIQTMYEVSRITVRRAYSDLEKDGYVKKIKGKGTFVTQKQKIQSVIKFKSFTDETLENGDDPSSIILDCDEIEASAHVSEMLKIEPGKKVGRLKRLRLVNGRIVELHETFINIDLGFNLDYTAFNAKTSLYELYRNQGFEPVCADEIIQAKMPSEYMKITLYMDENEPIFYRERISYLAKGEVLEYSQNYTKANHQKYFVHLS